ncbi:MAG: hypothetical protein WC635_12140 [Bacteriovorax sp.]|jgi:hypothetical protein
MAKLFQVILAFFLFSATAFASARVIYLTGDNRDYTCGYRNIVLQAIKGQKIFRSLVQALNLSPECLNSDQKRFIERTDNKIRGITFGISGGVSKIIGADAGIELVITIVDRNTLMAGIVSYKGGGASVSLPVGISITTGVLHGDCKTIENYLGHFHNFSLLGFNKSFGTTGEIFHRTKCDSSSNTDGFSMALLGYSVSNYRARSEFIMIRGERAEEFIQYIDQFHPIND